MTWTTDITPASGAAWAGSSRSLVPVEKTSADNGLHNRSTAGERRREPSDDRISQQSLTRSGTESAPRWHGPRLSAPFVAQILGQVLPQSGPDALSARAAYGHAGALLAAGRNFDQDV